ncbi:MAG TPA: homocysteine S-methyltransferase [Spirochaetota bacterium]|nr:homocysteine S-methyltransferase [Spirochaetota bacterium]HPF04679.1 homocysteine S-methyltransferase [Spirochaetota bacterium]HPJ41958.1 homocysteine S-methyltransferase [Spirochaetota bacterium]HPR37339.1 homocysteine S-methyltransferase [Spirochaetota bacterium]HRX46460.1 homocysteine S-methyltransferase [Spirochaetota bacterium]
MNHIERILEEYPFVVLDGGLATELEKAGHDLRDRLWSAKVLAEKPDAIMDIHRSYLEAGADCIITSSYQATVKGFMSAGYSKKDAGRLIKLSVKIAKDAVEQVMEKSVDNHRPEPFVASSAGCYGAYLADGSEYSGNYKLSLKEYKDFHRERLELLAEAGSDFIAFETFPNIDEGLAVSELMMEYPDIHYWIVFTAADENHISHGEVFFDCVKELNGKSNLAGIGINCSRPEFISPLLGEVNSFVKQPLVVYPNSGERFDIGCTCWKDESSKADFLQLTEEWYSLGARIIGGCCRTGPEDIRKISSYRKKLMV